MSQRQTFRWGILAILLPVMFAIAWVQYQWMGLVYGLIGCALGALCVWITLRCGPSSGNRANQHSS